MLTTSSNNRLMNSDSGSTTSYGGLVVACRGQQTLTASNELHCFKNSKFKLENLCTIFKKIEAILQKLINVFLSTKNILV